MSVEVPLTKADLAGLDARTPVQRQGIVGDPFFRPLSRIIYEKKRAVSF